MSTIISAIIGGFIGYLIYRIIIWVLGDKYPFKWWD